MASLLLDEPLEEAAKRRATTRLGIETQPKYHGIFRCIDRYDDSPFDDKWFAVHTAELSSDARPPAHNDVGKIVHLSDAGIRSHSGIAKNVIDILDFASQQSSYREEMYQLERADIFEESA